MFEAAAAIDSRVKPEQGGERDLSRSDPITSPRRNMISRAIVTGGAGFIGSHVVDALVADGVTVTVVDDLSSGRAERVAPDADLKTFSIVDGEQTAALFDAVKPEAVFHLAAQASVVVSTSDPAYDCAVNVHGTLNVLEAARSHRAPIVFTSTGGALYGNDAPIPTPETRIPAPLAPYGASKWAAEAYINTWAAAHDTPHAICRLGNVYGPRQSPHGEAGVVAIFSERIHAGRTPKMFGNGDPTRDYIHVPMSSPRCAPPADTGEPSTSPPASRRVSAASGRSSPMSPAADITPELAPLRSGRARALLSGHQPGRRGARRQRLDCRRAGPARDLSRPCGRVRDRQRALAGSAEADAEPLVQAQWGEMPR